MIGTRLALLLILAVSGSVALADTAPAVSIVTGTMEGPEARHGADEIVAALKARHVSVETVGALKDAKGKTLVVAGLAGDQSVFGDAFVEFRESVPDAAEALAIKKMEFKGKPVVAIAGYDDCGLMYAELDVADRIRWGTDNGTPLSFVRDTVDGPQVGTRGVTLFAMNRAYWESRFYDAAYWGRYFDMLAENRFNSMVVVFGYENGGFLAPCYPYFFDVPAYPEVRMVGITAEQQKRNVEALNRLITMAHARGIKVTVGIWDHIYRGNVQNGGAPGGNASLKQPTQSLVWGMTAENLIPYTQTALTTFLKDFPGLDGIQFRMHDESGLKVSEQDGFWRSIFQTIMQTSPKMPLDLRAKGLTPAEIKIATDSGVNFHLSTKYWMEQMGLPFHPAHINPHDQSNARHSYAGLLVYPQKYWVDWQLWTGGTARILLWGDPDYARRFIETTHLYGGDSFEVDEPLATKMEAQPHDAKPFDLLKPEARYYDYEFERYWHFFEVFGRIGYDADAPAEIWDMEFQKRFGADAGPVLEDALHRASWILPRIVASSFPYSGFPMTVGWAEKQAMGDLPTFAKGTLSETQVFESFDEEAQLLIENGETAKVRPEATSYWFAQTANAISADVAAAESKIGSYRGKEFESTVTDLKILAGLARYHSQRINAAVCYRLYDRTKDARALDDAIGYETKAVAAWREIVQAAGDMYAGDLTMGARSRDLCGSWKDELGLLETGLEKLHDDERKATVQLLGVTAAPRYVAMSAEPEGPVIAHDGIATARAGAGLTIRAHVSAAAGVKWVKVLYRAVNQTLDYKTAVMKAVDDKGDYEAVIQAGEIDPKFDFMYLLQAMDNEHHGVMYPDFNKRTPYFIVRVERGTG